MGDCQTEPLRPQFDRRLRLEFHRMRPSSEAEGTHLGNPGFKKEFAGVLVTDFWSAYTAVVAAHKQKCLPHLLRAIKRTQHYHKPDGDWPAFSKQLRRLIHDAIHLSKRRRELTAERFASRRGRLEDRLRGLLAQPWEDRHARRLVKRLRRHVSELFTFLDHPEVPSDNNHGERQIRPAVLVRKTSYANNSGGQNSSAWGRFPSSGRLTVAEHG